MSAKKCDKTTIRKGDKTDVSFYSYKPHPILSDLLEEYQRFTGYSKTRLLDVCISYYFSKNCELARALHNVLIHEGGDEK